MSLFGKFISKNTLRYKTGWPIIKIGFKFLNCYLAYCYLNKYSKGFIKQRNSASAHGCFWQPNSDEKAVSGIQYKLHSKGNYDV